MKPFSSELEERLQKISAMHGVSIITFIAPDSPVKISPVQYSSAQIDTKEMYDLEKRVRDCEKNYLPKKLHLVIHTPGGDLATSFKIASYLRSKFDDIHAFVPYEASSGGTLICCAANKISMGDLANLTSIDPQIRYKGFWVSAYAISRAIDGIQEAFKDKTPDELPSPWQQMSDKIDPVLYDEMLTTVHGVRLYAGQLLIASKYEESKAKRLALNLTYTQYPHSHCLMQDKAKDLGFNIIDNSGNSDIMDVYREIVTHCLKEAGDKHVIEHYCSASLQTPSPTIPTPTTPHVEPSGTAAAER